MSDITQRRGAIDAFLEQARQTPTRASNGRLIFAMDATLSRQPTWDMAQGVQQDMFRVAAQFGGLDVQLVYFRGLSECRASRFVRQGEGLAALMSRIQCQGGYTQIEKVFRHVRDESDNGPVGALIYVGDALEENPDVLCARAGEIAMRGVKAFMFHEGADPKAGAAFQEIARITGGAYAQFDRNAGQRLGALLGAVAAYASGGKLALSDRARKGDAASLLLLRQMDG